MNKFWKSVVLIVLFIGSAMVINHQKKQEPHIVENSEEVLTYFIDSITAEVKTTEKNYDKLGLAGGVDGFALQRTYPRLRLNNFEGIQAYQGGYSIEDNKLMFTGNAASNSGVIEREGMRMLIQNISQNLNMPINSKVDIDKILIEIKPKV